jgi:hypothetical protein
MKLSGYLDAYYLFTGKLSDINRQMAFAGIALIWIFKETDGTEVYICHELILPSIILALALGLDLFQYIYQSIAWGIFHRYHEKKANNKDIDLLAPSSMNYPSTILFILKVLSVIVAYYFIIRFLATKLL